MKKRLNEVSENIVKAYQATRALLRKIRLGKIFNTVRRVINGRGNTVIYKNAELYSVTFDIKGDDNRIEIMEGCVLNNVLFHVRGDNHSISIEKNCKFERNGSIWLEDSDCSLVIGEQSTFREVDFALTDPASRIRIGRECMFAYDIEVRTSDGHSIISLESGERINPARNVAIGDHVWIGAHSIILKGSSISDNSVVATGSVVTGCYETQGIIIGGNPARQLREGITWSRERIYPSR